MNFKNTEKLLNQKFADNDFDSYCVFVYAKGYERFIHSPNVNADTYFDIASMGKVLVTSPLILKAIGENKLSLDDTLAHFFDNTPKDKAFITIKQLLTHTSGIRRYDIPQEIADKGNDKVANFILHTSLAFEPGKSQEYSCNGMILLGYIIEKIYGKTLEEVFDEKIKTPLGYTRSKFNIEINEPNAAICYRTETLDGLSHPWDDENIRVLRTSAGSGGQFFTLNDINKYAKAIMNKSEALYPEKFFDLAEQNYIKDFDEGWGLGWLIVDGKYPQTGKLFPIGSFGHCGHTGTSLFFSREKDMYVIILTNATRCLNKKNGFKGYDYNKICEMRADIHNAIFDDLSESGLI